MYKTLVYAYVMTTRPQDQYTQVQGHTVRYWTQGDTGSTVLLLHGISCSVLEWEHTIAALATQHRVIALDLLGCGLSDKPLDADYGLVVWGKQDKFLPVTHVEVLKPLLANAQFELIDNCGHVPMTEITQRFNQMVLTFLSSHA